MPYIRPYNTFDVNFRVKYNINPRIINIFRKFICNVLLNGLLVLNIKNKILLRSKTVVLIEKRKLKCISGSKFSRLYSMWHDVIMN